MLGDLYWLNWQYSVKLSIDPKQTVVVNNKFDWGNTHAQNIQELLVMYETVWEVIIKIEVAKAEADTKDSRLRVAST